MTATLWRIRAEDAESKNTEYVAAYSANRAIELFLDRYRYKDEDVRYVKRATNQVVNAAELVAKERA